MTTPSWLSRSLKPCIYSSVHSCHLFLISFVSVTTSYCFVLYHAHPCTKCSFDISNIIELFSCLSHSIFPLFLCIVHLRRLSSLSLLFSETLHLLGISFPFSFCLSLLFSQLFVRPSSDNHFALHLFFLRMVLVTTSYTMLQTSTQFFRHSVYQI